MSDDLTIAYMLGVEDMRSKLHKQADEIERLRAENEKLRREAAIRIDQIEREQEAHLRTIDDYNSALVENEKLRDDYAIERLRERLAEADEANRRVSDENEKLHEALAAERERCAKIAEQARDDTCDGPVAWSMADGIAAAIRESE